MSSFRQAATWLIGSAAVLLAAPAITQNIDAGKSPAQIFADTCAGCHRSAGALKRTSQNFLRAHYTTGSQEAAAMANYLAGVPGEPKRQPADGAKQNPKQNADQGKSPQGQAKGKQGATAQARPPVAEEKPPEPPPPPATPTAPPAPAAPVAPPLEPFEE
ncbi:MAG: hypothetical protein QOG83_3477 [Alphaproteobacteria bacterium]|nr:hypothetical protein [Alphaproteobacteria bacterium]